MGHCRNSQDRKTSINSFGRRVGILVVVCLLLAEGLLVEAKGGRGGGRSRGRSWGGGGGGGGGGGTWAWETLKSILIVVAVIVGLLIILCICCAVCCVLCSDNVDNTGAKGETLPDEEDKRYIQGN